MEKGWVYFKYERLPIYCYQCGILGHQERECHKAKKGCISSEEDDFQFGPWLWVVGPMINRGRTSHSKSKSREVEDDIFQESNEEDGDRKLSSFPRQLNSSSPIRKPFGEITIAISLDDSTEILGC